MKFGFPIVFLVLSFFVHDGSGQSSNPSNSDWIRLESPDKDFSVAVPSNYLVNVKKTAIPAGVPGIGSTFSSTSREVFAFEDGVTISVDFIEQDWARSNLARVKPDVDRSPVIADFRIKGLSGKSIIYQGTGYEIKLFVASDSAYYVASVSGRSKDDLSVLRFLMSVRIKGEPLFKGLVVPADNTVLSAKSLKTSPEIVEALDRKAAKIERKVTYTTLAEFGRVENETGIRPAFVVSVLKPAYGSDIPVAGGFKVRLKLLANGQVGEIVVATDLGDVVARAFAEAAKNVKFVPAEKNGVPTDSFHVISASAVPFRLP